MSRTDVHRPYWVLMLDPTVRHWFKEVHQHLYEPCTLKKSQPWWFDQRPFRGCYLTYSATGPNLCGCGLCTDQFGRKLKRRQDRVSWRARRQDLLQSVPRDLWRIEESIWDWDAHH